MSCTPREARKRITSKDYTDYVAFFNSFPWSYDAAFLGCLISNLCRGKNDEPAHVSDFMPADQIAVDPLDATWDSFRKWAGVDSDGKHIDTDS